MTFVFMWFMHKFFPDVQIQNETYVAFLLVELAIYGGIVATALSADFPDDIVKFIEEIFNVHILN